MRAKLPPGIERTSTGFRAYVCVTSQKTRHRANKRFPAGTSIDTIVEWRTTTRAKLTKRLTQPPTIVGAGFVADAERYLEAVQALPTYKERRRHILEWAVLFGERPRDTITAAEIRAQRDRWLTVGPKAVQERQPDGSMKWVDHNVPLSASAVNHRLRALENLYTVLDGRHAPNPVRDVPEAPTPDVTPRAIPYPLIKAILNALPDRSRPVKGQARETQSKTKARLKVIAFVGLSHAQLMRVQPEDVDLRARTLFLRPRQKGHLSARRRGVTIPLTLAGVKAFRELAALDGWGTFSASSMRKSFKRACEALKLPLTLTPYDLRHSFGTLAYASSGDLHATGVLLGHRDSRTTARYALGAVDPRLAAAVQSLRFGGVRRGGSSPPKQARRDRSAQVRTVQKR